MKSNTPVTALALAALAGAAHASVLGLDNAPLGATAESSVGFAHWDTFATVAFTDRASNTADADRFTANLDSTTAAGMVLGSGERLYSGSGATANAFAFTLDVAAVADFDRLTLQIKSTSPLQTGAAQDKQIAASSHFAISSGLSTPVQSYVGSTTEGANTFFIYAWTWTGLDLAAGESVTLGITSAPGHVSIDGLRLDASAIPEPSAFAALAGLSVLGLAATRRRRA